jgi:hypothetical protein
MSEILERIDAWLAVGLIDPATAERLRQAELAAGPATAITATSAAASSPPPTARDGASTAFGPTPTVAEVFVYLGAAFLLAAWSTFMVRLSDDRDPNVVVTVGASVVVAVMLGIAAILLRGDARRRRGAGVAVLVATSSASIAAATLSKLAGLDDSTTAIVIALAATIVALIGRWMLPAVLTQIALLTGLTWLGASLLNLLLEAVYGKPAPCCDTIQPVPTDPFRLVVVPAAGWLLVALGIGLVGLAESRSRGAAAQRRAAVSRFWAGVVAVGGVAGAVTREAPLSSGAWGRVIEPWIGELAILAVTAVLVERALRRDSIAFVGAAAVGLVLALTDFNVHYLGDTRELALLVQGGILLLAGFLADRLRRRIDRSRHGSTDGPSDPPPPVVEATAV